ncbi:CLUMA_CG011761, isoform A [Clunio marinus]|uniref:CLUMA_CG011761, isoform A n=1 Tax=Clunio marinus TaxID=568069 RepID=A0A1J1IF64_9DIPT|nr:CLUMA_CG011761, isoform A [Clunio marinus]
MEPSNNFLLNDKAKDVSSRFSTATIMLAEADKTKDVSSRFSTATIMLAEADKSPSFDAAIAN